MCYYNVKELISQKYKTKLVSTRRVILGVLKNTRFFFEFFKYYSKILDFFSSILSITQKYSNFFRVF
jgi:hypothetical protein